MKQLAYVIVGVIIGYAAGYLLVSIFAQWYEPRFVKSDDDIGTAYFYSLIFLAVTSISGGIAGFKLSAAKT